MLVIDTSSKVNVSALNKNLTKYKLKQLKLDSDSIRYSLKKMEKLDTRGNTTYKSNVDLIKEYLKKLEKLTTKKEISLEFKVSDNKIKSYPFETKKIPYFDIETTDYMNISDKSIVNIDYSEMMNALAFEVCYRDLGYNIKEVDNMLSDIPIIGISDNDKLMELVDGFTYIQAFGMVVKNTAYTDVSKRYFINYFGDKIKRSDKYKSLLESSFTRIMSLIIENMLVDIIEKEIKVEIAGIYDTSLVLVADDKNCVKIEEIDKQVSIRLFGRYFKFIPEVVIY